ncbi:hypothetical protein D3C81_2174650 [compost metagenome]
MSATLPSYSYLGSASSSNKIAIQADLAGKADKSELAGKADRSSAGYNIAFDAGTRTLKLYSVTGALLGMTNIPQ